MRLTVGFAFVTAHPCIVGGPHGTILQRTGKAMHAKRKISRRVSASLDGVHSTQYTVSTNLSIEVCYSWELPATARLARHTEGRSGQAAYLGRELAFVICAFLDIARMSG
jgi:hypothetical protein